ncbi:hypothetical protein DRQ25_09310 [Candidatus Fermentibacteria bacterium]|nr:MAG: hypothetical protein DRQ25_09310 [Candidatus Fermentibacteria bacterium]
MNKQMVVILMLIISCASSLSWEITSADRVDSMSVFQNEDGILEVYIECGMGIGSISLDFEEPVKGDSIRITLMYDSLHSYSFCESLILEFTGGRDMDLWIIDHSMIDLREDGSVSLPVEEGIMMLRIGWIDFYRG